MNTLLKGEGHVEGAPMTFQKAKHMVPDAQSSQWRRRTPLLTGEAGETLEVSFPCTRDHCKSPDLNTCFS